MSRKTPRSLWTVAAVLLAAAFVIGEIGDTFGAWTSFAEWLFLKLGLDTNDVVLKATLFVIAVLLLALLTEMVRTRGRRRKEPLVEDSDARAAYLRWFGKDIENRLRSSIHWARFIDLNTEEEVDAVLPWWYSYQDLQDRADVRQCKNIQEVLAGGESRVLLLGGPGSGKTTTLLNVAQGYHRKAAVDLDASIPVLLNLSLWGQAGKEGGPGQLLATIGLGRSKSDPVENPRIKDWLVAMLTDLPGAGVSQAAAKRWIDEKRVWLFLDGLDEAKEELRGKLARELNAFFEEFPDLPVFVCSRSADYEALVEMTSVKLRLDSAVSIHPLTPEQIDDYLESAGATKLKLALERDAELREMAKTPLELSLMVVAFADDAIEREIERGGLLSTTARRMHLFESFVDTMMQRKARRDSKRRDEINLLAKERLVTAYSVTRVNRTLGWLAQRMSERSRSSVRMKDLFSFLWEFGRTEAMSARNFTCAIVIGLLVGAIRSFLGGPIFDAPTVLASIVLGLVAALAYLGLMWALEWRERDRNIFNLVCVAVPVWLALPPVSAFVSDGASMLLPMPHSGWVIWGCLLWGLGILAVETIRETRVSLGRRLLVVLAGLTISIGTAYPLVKSSGLGGGWALLCAPVAFLLYFNLTILVSDPLDKGQIGIYAFSGFAVSGLLVGALLGKPGQLEASLVAGTLLVGIFASGADDPSPRTTVALATTFSIGAIAAGVGGLGPASVWVGLVGFLAIRLPVLTRILGEAGSRSVASPILRCCLKTTGRLPLRMDPFVDYCVDALLLKRSNRELEFVHRRLRDYFAIREGFSRLRAGGGERRRATVEALCRLRDASCDVLLELVGDRDKEVRIACIQGLGAIGSASAAQSLFKVIRTTGRGLRGPATKAIGQVKDVGALPLLLKTLEADRGDDLLRRSTLEALGRMDRLDVVAREVDLVDFLSVASDSVVVLPAVQELIRRGRLEEPQLLKALRSLNLPSSPEHRKRILATLSELPVADLLPGLLTWISRGWFPRKSSTFRSFRKEEVAAELLRLASETKFKERMLALELLGELKAKSVATSLLVLLADEDLRFVAAVVNTMTRLGARDLLPDRCRPPSRISAWRSKCWLALVSCLGDIRHFWREAFLIRRTARKLAAALEDGDTGSQVEALQEATQFGISPQASRILGAGLVGCLGVSDADVRRAAIVAMHRFDLDLEILLQLACFVTGQNLTVDEDVFAIPSSTTGSRKYKDRVRILRLIEWVQGQERSFKAELGPCIAQLSPSELEPALITALLARESTTKVEVLRWIESGSWKVRLPKRSRMSKSIVVGLVRASNDPEASVRSLAIQLLIREGSPIPVATVLKAIDSSYWAEQKVGVQAAGVLKIKEAKAKLLSHLKATDNAGIWSEIAEALRALNEDTALSRLLTAHIASNPEIRTFAVAELASLGSQETIESLIAMTKSDEPDLRGHAARCLGKIGHGQANERLLELLADDSLVGPAERVCDIAAEALDEIGTPSVKRELDRWRGDASRRP